MKISLLATLLLCTASASALNLAPGNEYTLRGEVSSMQPDQMFFLRSGDDRVLIYASAAQVGRLQVGDRIKVRGMVPADWIKLANLELQAIEVTPQ